jgi:LysM repeat protein
MKARLLTRGLSILLLGSLTLTGTSCSSKKAPSKEPDPFESEFIVEEAGPSSEENIISLDDDLYAEIEDNLEEETTYAADNIYDDVDKVEAFNTSVKEDVFKVLSENFKTYEVKGEETLMWIAFKLYGDYRAWKNLKEWNQDVVDFDNSVKPGSKLKYEPLNSKFDWKNQGSPYLIHNGDTLFKISRKVYQGEGQYWKDIWQNNQLQIRDPNLIFAGFTLFYLPYDQIATRDLASDEQE